MAKSKENLYGVRLVKPHSPDCLYSRRPERARGSTFYLNPRSPSVYRARDGRNFQTGSSFRWLRLTCLLSETCQAEALIRLDKIEEITENTIRQIKKGA